MSLKSCLEALISLKMREVSEVWRAGVGQTRASPLYVTRINNGKAAGKMSCNEIPLKCNKTLDILQHSLTPLLSPSCTLLHFDEYNTPSYGVGC